MAWHVVQRSTERFLQRQAYIISGLRRKVSSRKVQRYWRTFAQKRRTTRALAIQFVGTGVTSLQLPASDEVSTSLWCSMSSNVCIMSIHPCSDHGFAQCLQLLAGLGPKRSEIVALALLRIQHL